MSTEHNLKTDPINFDLVRDGKKTFEIRFNDRKFQVGDTVLLVRTLYTGVEMKEGRPLSYSGQAERRRIIHILHGPIYGLAPGWVIMSLSSEGLL